MENRDIYYLLFRHGEPEAYGKTSAHLSRNGIAQVNELSTSILTTITDFSLNKNKSAEVIFLSSKRPRTRESLDIVRKNVLAYKKEYELDISAPSIQLTKSSYNKLLLTTDPINKIIPILEKEDEPISLAYRRHFQMNLDLLRKLNIPSPEEITDQYIQEFRRLRSMSTELGSGPVRFYIGATHETTLGALDYVFSNRRISGEEQPNIGFAAYMIVGIKKDTLFYQIHNTNYFNPKIAQNMV